MAGAALAVTLGSAEDAELIAVESIRPTLTRLGHEGGGGGYPSPAQASAVRSGMQVPWCGSRRSPVSPDISGA